MISHTEYCMRELKCFPFNAILVIFIKTFIFKKIGNFAYLHSYYKLLEKNHVADVRHRAFESTPGNIINCSDYAECFLFEPDGQL